MKTLLFIFVLFFIFAISTASAADRNTLVIGLAADAASLDPHDINETVSYNVSMNIFDTLLSLSQDLKIRPLLATSYEMINDNTWEFNLRKDVKFHNGEKFNASTVKFNFDRVMDPKSKLKMATGDFQAFLERIEVINDYKVRILTKYPLPYLDGIFCHAPMIIPPKHIKDKGPSFIAGNPVGSGPYKFVRWARDEHIVLESNESYWRGNPRIKKVIFRSVPDESS